MGLIRRLTPANRRLLLALFACAMLVRALVPAGWMPSTDGGLMLCDGMAPPIPMAGHAMANGAMHGHVGHDAPAPTQPQSGDHPCAFAGPVAAMDAPQPSLVPPPVPARHLLSPTRLLVGIGRGLAAPPPPQTGPPAFA